MVLVQVFVAAALVGRRGALRDDAFEPHLGRPVVERAAVADDMVAELDRRAPADMAGQQLRQQRLAPDERRLGEIPAVEVEKVEGVEDELVAGAFRQRVLQQPRTG